MNYFCSLSLSLARLSTLPFLDLRFLEGIEEYLALADIFFPLVFPLLILGTERECEHTELRGGEPRELGGWNYTKKHWEWGQGDSLEASHYFSLYYSWALSFLVPRDETAWDWDHESTEDDSHVTVRLQLYQSRIIRHKL